MTSEPAPLLKLMGRPNRLVARLILAELIAKRGKGPLRRRDLRYRRVHP
jgi:hypothetical protein